jgi:hypothetical protein
MANKIKPLNELTKVEVQKLIDACISFDAGNILGPDHKDSEVLSYSIPDMDLSWANKEIFGKEIKELTGSTSIVAAEKVLEKQLSAAPAELGARAPTKAERETQEEERVKREAQLKETAQKARDGVEAAIKRQEEIQESLKGKVIYAKVEIPPPPEETNENVTNFINEAKNHPKSFESDLAQNIKEKLSPILSENLNDEEISLLSQKVASDTVTAINNPQAQLETNKEVALLNSLNSDTTITPTLITNPKTLESFKNASAEISFFKNSTAISRNVIGFVNKDLALRVFGPAPEDIKITFFNQPVEGYTHSLNFDQLNGGYTNLLQSQSQIFDSFGSLAKGEVKNILLGQARTLIDSQIAKLPADSAITGLYNSAFGQQILSFVGLGKTVPFSEGLVGQFVLKIPGASAFFEGLGNFLGVDFGITAAAPVAEVAGATIAATEGVVAAEGVAVGVETGVVAAGAAGATAAGAEVAAGAAVAPATGGLSLIIAAITAVATVVVPKIINWIKDKVGKFGKYAIAGVGALFGGLIGGVGGAVIGGLGTYGITTFLTGGVPALQSSLSVFGAGLANFVGALGSAFIGEVGIPILTTLLVFPVVVALILFIINAGAYLVPPNAGVGAHYGPHDCSTETKIVERAEAINKNLLLGFINYYNRSPDYPELWNAQLFATEPDPENQNDVIGMEDMFWCNYMPLKSYLTINLNLPFSLTAMMNYFISQQKWNSGEVATTEDICPGDAIFFKSPADTSILSHVAVVESVTDDEIITVQSNSPWKKMTYFTDSSGHFPIYGTGNATIRIVGFGAP